MIPVKVNCGIKEIHAICFTVGTFDAINVKLFYCLFGRPFVPMAANVSICVRAGLPKPRPVPDTERTKDTKTLDYASTPLDANTLLCCVALIVLY